MPCRVVLQSRCPADRCIVACGEEYVKKAVVALDTMGDGNQPKTRNYEDFHPLLVIPSALYIHIVLAMFAPMSSKEAAARKKRDLKMFVEDESPVLSSAIRAVVRGGEPYCCGTFMTSSDMLSSIRLTHLAYTPPKSMAELRAYKPNKASSSCSLKAIEDAKDGDVFSVRAMIQTLTINNTVETMVLACFPLAVSRVKAVERAMKELEKGAREQTKEASSSSPGMVVMLGDGNAAQPVTLPLPSDIAANLNIRFDPDGSTALIVDGPGEVTFYGEQLTAVVEDVEGYHNHHGGIDGDIIADESDGSIDIDWDEMARLVRP